MILGNKSCLGDHVAVRSGGGLGRHPSDSREASRGSDLVFAAPTSPVCEDEDFISSLVASSIRWRLMTAAASLSDTRPFALTIDRSASGTKRIVDNRKITHIDPETGAFAGEGEILR